MFPEICSFRGVSQFGAKFEIINGILETNELLVTLALGNSNVAPKT